MFCFINNLRQIILTFESTSLFNIYFSRCCLDCCSHWKLRWFSPNRSNYVFVFHVIMMSFRMYSDLHSHFVVAISIRISRFNVAWVRWKIWKSYLHLNTKILHKFLSNIMYVFDRIPIKVYIKIFKLLFFSIKDFKIYFIKLTHQVVGLSWLKYKTSWVRTELLKLHCEFGVFSWFVAIE